MKQTFEKQLLIMRKYTCYKPLVILTIKILFKNLGITLWTLFSSFQGEYCTERQRQVLDEDLCWYEAYEEGVYPRVCQPSDAESVFMWYFGTKR